jgi:hypothetical protein
MNTTNTMYNEIRFSAQSEGIAFTSVLDAILFALDEPAIGFTRTAKKGSKARVYASSLTEHEAIACYTDASDEFDAVAQAEPDAAELIRLAIEFGLRLFAGDKVKDVLTPRWANVEAFFLDSIDFEAMTKRTHQEWIQWFLDAAELNPSRQAIQDGLAGVIDDLYEGGVVHGRFYAQNSLAWSAWSCIGYPLVGLAQFPNGAGQILEGAAVMAALIRIHAGDASNGIATREAGEFLDVQDEESGKLASSFVSMTTGPGSEKQRAPFPENFQELFVKEVEAFAKKHQQLVGDRAAIVGYEMDETEAGITGVKQSHYTDLAVAKARSVFAK